MAPVLKCCTSDSTLSTSSSGTPCSGRRKVKQPAQKAGAAFVDTVRKLAEQAVVAAAHGFLQQVDGLGVVAVDFAPAAQLVPPERGQRGVGGQAQRVKRAGVRFVGAAGDVRQRDAADAADGAGEVFVNDFAADAQRLEQLAAPGRTAASRCPFWTRS